ncbi:hypothetical protein BpHYR1_031964 [Brachionus plicatilis]|uniref:Uncharacterized protein n=1 Tax=Brachionus plicatilis TaxID=10195 RepID=A0A3M7PRA3_BRAPC|nr:hypothetical protein BpHYR1_031964 [Brachionus plicatilis]
MNYLSHFNTINYLNPIRNRIVLNNICLGHCQYQFYKNLFFNLDILKFENKEKTRKKTFLKFTEVAVDLSDKKLQNRVYIYVRSFRKATIYRLCLKKSKDLWLNKSALNEQKFLDKANSIPYHFADWRKFSFLEMEGPIFKKQEYNSKLKGVWWGVDKACNNMHPQI